MGAFFICKSYFDGLKIANSAQFIILRMILNRSAHQKFATIKPGTIQSTKSIKAAFTISANRPKVITVIGSASICTSGLIKVFIRPRINAVIKAAINPSTATPGNK